ncbi:MAG: DNA polymerase III subunit gamma/tau [Oscillospiraceae bacterium]|nr:DNA polymerase III subunit gamma/tau [Oscillospiraceae bacterium]
MYQVLYRKWRSPSFAEVVGQPHVTTTLLRALESGRLSHAYLFTGPRGTGKTSCARILAKAVNCEAPQNGEPCNKCALCRGIDSGSVLDVIEIDAASNNGVDNIRDLRDETNFTPAQGKYRVYIIDEVHMLSAGAFNALLKTLEEPPSYVIFILATTEVHKLPATVLSRCQRFDFHRISAEDVRVHLLHVAREEGIALEEDAAWLLARVADGAMRDALSLLDLCRVEGGAVTAAHAARCVGMADRRYLFELTGACLRKDIPACLALLHTLYQDACDMERLCEELLRHLRNLLILRTVKHPRDLVVCTEEDFKLYQEQAGQASDALLLRFMESLEETSATLRRGGDRRMEMELALIRLCVDTRKEPPVQNAAPREDAALSRRLAALERSVAALQKDQAFPSDDTINKERKPMEEPPAPEPEEISPQEDELPFGEWEEVLALLKTANPPLSGILTGSRAFTRGDFVLIQSENPSLPVFLNQASHAASLKELILQVTGRQRVRLGPYRGTADGSGGGGAPKDPLSLLAERADALASGV